MHGFDPQNLQYTIGALLYIALIIAFSFYYASIIFKPIEVSADLKKRGASVMKTVQEKKHPTIYGKSQTKLSESDP